ncbi:MFS transporter [Microbacterium dauci]|uniref:MFS transporter n=1 Tax=Microbacterium dauci TaxID=3048008 RepID=A0ABT6ZHD8_9MICO|nr:MFS transporter [Microbacterium sp. LX3-4]MDJ1115572.1 MFS transporter [Microbacterium sp. LX3-4]
MSRRSMSELVRAVGTWYFAIALIARLPYAMIVVGVLTMVVDARGSLAVGGLTSAMVGLGTIITGPLIGAAADRWGQRPVLLLAAVVQTVVLLALVAVAYSGGALGLLLMVAALAGATAPQVSPMSRARLVGAIDRVDTPDRGRLREATMGYESAVDEVVFVFGPVLVGVVALAADPAAPVLAAAALTLLFVSAFALHPTARTTAHAEALAARAPAAAVLRSGTLVAAAGTFATGLFFGAMLTSLTAFAGERGFPEQTGILYGIMGVGSAVLALAVGLLPRRFTLPWRWIGFTAVVVIGAVLATAASGAVSMGWALALAGCGIGPTLATVYAIAAARAPRGREATVMSILGSSVIVGQALASMLVGLLAEGVGAGAALWTPLVAAVLLLGAGGANLRVRRDVPERVTVAP